MSDDVSAISSAEDEGIRPFEWLTDSISLIPLLKSKIAECNEVVGPCRILHVGSGSSQLGEYIVRHFAPDEVELVVNVDKDLDTLHRMESQWEMQKTTHNNRLAFVGSDFSCEKISRFPPGKFHIVVDKSTLDCTLCSDKATAGLLCEVHRLLDSKSGVGKYIIISFHHIDLLRPLLKLCPGTDWEISHSIVMRQVEDLVNPLNKGKKFVLSSGTDGNISTSPLHNQHSSIELQEHSSIELQEGTALTRITAPTMASTHNQWATGSFEPDETYRRTVNVVICHKQSKSDKESLELDYDAVVEHVNNTNDEWFRVENPILTNKRIETMRKEFLRLGQEGEFAVDNSGHAILDLKASYRILFTEAEREHLTFEYFLEDWEAFTTEHYHLQHHVDLQGSKTAETANVSFETAISFLKEMQ